MNVSSFVFEVSGEERLVRACFESLHAMHVFFFFFSGTRVSISRDREKRLGIIFQIPTKVHAGHEI